MIYQDVKRYLKNTFNKPTIDFEWSVLKNIKLFAFLEARYTSEEISREVFEIKEAFKDFFEPVGKIIFRYKDEIGIHIKVFPYRVNPKDSKHLQHIITIIHHNRKSIEYPYRGQNDQIAILGKIRREVNREISDSDESVNSKELIKHAIRVALDLKDRDIVIQLKRKYIVKIFSKNRVLEKEVQEDISAPKERKGIQNRFNGYSPEEIEETYKDIFVKGDVKIEYFLKSVMRKIFLKKLNFNVISNDFYESKSLGIIQVAITKELTDYLSLEKDFITGVSGYLMRKHFQEIHEIMAIKLIECIYNKNANAKNFLLHYTGQIILSDNKKYKIPSLETEDGQKWNSGSLICICNLWMHTKRKRKTYEHKLSEINIRIDELEKTLLYIKPEKDSQEKVIAETEKKFKDIEKHYLEVEAKLKYLEITNLNSDEYFAMQKKFEIAKENYLAIKQLRRDAKKNLSAIKDANSATFNDLEDCVNTKQKLINSIKMQDLNIDGKHSQIDPILRSIVKVLMARTKLVRHTLKVVSNGNT
jgi:hypothetical protein